MVCFIQQLSNDRIGKMASPSIVFHTDIANANCFHATCRQEMEHIRNFGYAGPIAIIPNPTVCPDF